MTLILILTSIAFAAEPSSVADADVSIAAAKEARSAAIDSYRKKLEGQKSAAKAKLETANSGCDSAKTVWLAMQDPLAATNTELKLVPLSDVSPEIAAANASYRKELEKLKAGYDAKIAAAVKDATVYGGTITAVKADIAKIDAELKRLDEQAEAEAKAARQAECIKRYGEAGEERGDWACSTTHSYGGGSFGSIDESSGVLEALRSQRSRVVYLPAEFAACFPSEVRNEVDAPLPSSGTVRPIR